MTPGSRADPPDSPCPDASRGPAGSAAGAARDDGKLARAMDWAIEKIGRSNRNKPRPVFYYLLVRSLKKESVFV